MFGNFWYCDIIKYKIEAERRKFLDNKLIGNENNIIFYNDEDGQTKIEVIL